MAAPLKDDDICTAIDKLSSQSIGVNDIVADTRRKAYEFYYGEAKGDLAPGTIPGRSEVVSKDVMEVVEWIMPTLMKMFTSTDDIVRFEPDGPEDMQSTEDATNYIGYLIHRKNDDAFITLHDAIKSALICGSGPGKCYVETKQEPRPETYEGLTEEQLRYLYDDPEITVDKEFYNATDPQLVDAECTRAEDVQMFRNEGIPPEELRILAGTRTITDPDFIEHRREVTIAYLREQGWPEDKIDQLSSNDEQAATQEDDDARTNDKDEHTDAGEVDESMRKVDLSEAYLRLDVEGTGKPKYWRVVKADKVLFEKEETDDHIFWFFTPILMPHQLVGLSMFDLLEDLQKIKTAIERQTLDNLYLLNNPMREVVIKQVQDMDALQSPRIGGYIPVSAIGAVREVQTLPLGQAGLQMTEFYSQRRDSRSGVTEMNSALNGESLAQTNVGSQGVEALMSAGAQRVELIARVLAETGFKRMYYLMLKNVVQHQNRPQQMRINNRWLEIDPREWRNKYNMTVSVGTGSYSKREAISNLRAVGAMQKELAAMGMVKPQHVYNTAQRVIEQMGYRDVEQFIMAPAEGAEMPKPQGGPPDPTAGLVAAEQVKAQASLQKAQMDNENKLVIEREKIASEERVAMFRAQQDAQLARQKWQQELAQQALQPTPMPMMQPRGMQ